MRDPGVVSLGRGAISGRYSGSGQGTGRFRPEVAASRSVVNSAWRFAPGDLRSPTPLCDSPGFSPGSLSPYPNILGVHRMCVTILQAWGIKQGLLAVPPPRPQDGLSAAVYIHGQYTVGPTAVDPSPRFPAGRTQGNEQGEEMLGGGMIASCMRRFLVKIHQLAQ